MASNSAIDQLRKDEGFRLRSYDDTKKIRSIGYGYNLEKDGAKDDLVSVGVKSFDDIVSGKENITKDQAEALFQVSLSRAEGRAKRFVKDFHKLPQTAKDTLVNMSYQLGNNIREFKELKKSLESGDFSSASKDMLASDWAKQTPSRAKRLSKIMGGIKGISQVTPTALGNKKSVERDYRDKLRDLYAEQMTGVMSRESMIDNMAKNLQKVQVEASSKDKLAKVEDK